MNIGCDLDGVIIDHSYNQALMLAERGFVIPRQDISKQKLKNLLTAQEYNIFKRELYDTRGQSGKEINGALSALHAITKQGHTIHIISRRDKSSAQAFQWIKAHGILSVIPQSHIHFVQTYQQKEDLCRIHAIVTHIDDSPEVFDALRTPRLRILFDPFAHHHYDHNVITTARSWNDILLYLKQIKTQKNSLQHYP